jgi:hypothetical protein
VLLFVIVSAGASASDAVSVIADVRLLPKHSRYLVPAFRVVCTTGCYYLIFVILPYNTVIPMLHFFST